MYNYIRGTITEIKADYITLETAGVGYKILTPNPYQFKIGEESTLHLYQKVAEDEISLFGFPEADQRDLFLKLISVNGIGPKSAKAILAAGDVESISSAIESGNAKYLQKFPGIGPKASQQIILDLQGKIEFEASSALNDNLADVDEALQALGYNAKEIKKVIAKLDKEKPTNELVKDALRLMLK
ncbi:MAG: Holliday junction branch migration protein RuvA [Bacilli bacterium]|nr:Holliday junction branch migration protein RuvA [Bacilli bacterium]MBN2696782.1 Holliday junction branch migration protein RuvA [Bacilli bacterium]